MGLHTIPAPAQGFPSLCPHPGGVWHFLVTLCSHGQVGNTSRMVSEQSKRGARQQRALNLWCLGEVLGMESEPQNPTVPPCSEPCAGDSSTFPRGAGDSKFPRVPKLPTGSQSIALCAETNLAGPSAGGRAGRGVGALLGITSLAHGHSRGERAEPPSSLPASIPGL